jgi:hypothetical protein
MDKQLIESNAVSATELLDLIGHDYLKARSDELQADKWVIKLQTKTVISLLILQIVRRQ